MVEIDNHSVAITPVDSTFPSVLVHARGKMDAFDLSFWEDLRKSLRCRGHELFVIAHNVPQVATDVPVLCVPNGCDRVPQDGWQHGWRSWLSPLADADEFIESLLARERLWWGNKQAEGDDSLRRQSLDFFSAFYGAALAAVKPVLCVIWNGTHAQEMILAQLCREAGCPLSYIERAPFRGLMRMAFLGDLPLPN